ncbi:centrosomal protein of 83 kDa-like [Stylophora pistillata]|uniref:centrosomal protein of 83 kDa-like n=1 Tax=Stylophora pistillata TaxID=50429 RepID=UPI000C044ABD|nr:centrosomal protein of 83 kDa-like [Stylophora pistillata]
MMSLFLFDHWFQAQVTDIYPKPKQKKSDEKVKEKGKQKSKPDAEKQEVADLKRQLKTIEVECEKLRGKNRQLRHDLENKIMEEKKAKTKWTTEAKARKDAENDLSLSRKECESVEARLNRLQNKSNENVEKVKREERSKLKETEKKLEAAVKARVEESESLKIEIKNYEAKLKDLQKNSDEKLEKAKQEEKSKLDAKERELAKLEGKLEGQKSENKNLRELLDKLKVENARLKEVLDKKAGKLEETEEKFRAQVKGEGDALNKLAKLRERSGRVFRYKNDSDKYGVIYWMGSNTRTVAWENPSEKSDLAKRVSASRSSDKLGSASDLLNYTKTKRKISCTEDKKESWWSVALSEKFSLYLTHYTLRHGGDNEKSFLRNWQLEGSIDGSDCNWKVLKKHSNDWTLEKSPSHIATWSIEGEVGAFRFFKIVQTGKNSSKDYGIYLSGIELYGVLIEGPNS